MGYRKIVQYGNITEIYDYENKIRYPKHPSWIQAERLVNGSGNNEKLISFDVIKKRKKLLKLQSKNKGIYIRTKRSIKRSREAFFRLCHHNNCNADSINFLTLTFAYDLPYKEASRNVSEFFRRVQKAMPEISISYISVPELTKKGRFHFHLLVYNLPPKTSELERETRNFQRLFQRGYLDISLATYNSLGIAGYMAKYMAKAIVDAKNETTRGYTHSRNIIKYTTAGSNTFDQYNDLVIPTDNIVEVEESSYDVPYLGLCRFKKITTKL